MIAYLDSSAIVKLVIEEPESEALGRALDRWSRLASAELAGVEVLRAVRVGEDGLLPRASQVLGGLTLIRFSRSIQDAAAVVEPGALRSLDAIHIASAQSLRDELSALISYDMRLLSAAEGLGLPTLIPH